MKRTILTIITMSVLLAGCKEDTKNTGEARERTTEQPAPTSRPAAPKVNIPGLENRTEAFAGEVNRQMVVFEHRDYTFYRLTEGSDVTQGVMNTEKGFEQDVNATLYILNSDKPESEQRYFVRYSNGRFVMLDPQRQKIPLYTFAKIE
jgi:hypothetical protein